MADFTPRMPEVEVVPDIEERFQQARQDAGNPKERKVAIMTPPRLAMFQDCPKPRTATRDMIDEIQRVFGAQKDQVVTAIALTDVDAILEDWTKAIPFAGYLLGLGYLGHNVVAFEGHPSAMAAACRGANLLVVDTEMEPFLAPDWVESARAVMRQDEQRILSINREGRIFLITRGW